MPKLVTVGGDDRYDLGSRGHPEHGGGTIRRPSNRVFITPVTSLRLVTIQRPLLPRTDLNAGIVNPSPPSNK